MPIVTTGEDVTTLEEAYADYLSPHGWTVTRTGTDLQQMIREHGAVIRCSLLPGGVRGKTETVSRLRVEVFAAGYNNLWLTGEAVSEAILDAPRPRRVGPFRIDEVENESDFAEQSYHESVRLLAAVFRVTTRSARS